MSQTLSTLIICWGVDGLSPGSVSVDSIALTTSIPLATSPKTACLPSSQGVTTVVRKNCDPPVLGPAFAIEKMPGLSCFFNNAEDSQGIFQPGPPLPALPLFGSLE